MKLINPEVRIETTNYCNAQCVMCNHSQMDRSIGVMMNEVVFKLIKQAIDLGATLITPFGFGEPLMDKDLVTKIQYCTAYGLDSFITTNASLCYENRVKALYDAGLTHIRFSVHGLNRIDYEDVQLGLDWKQTIINIYRAIQIRDADHYDTKISLTVIPMRVEHLYSIRKFWENCSDYLEIWQPHNWSCVKDYRPKTKARRKTCGRLEKGPVQIQWDGTVIPCCFLTDSEIILGNTHEQTVEQILKGE